MLSAGLCSIRLIRSRLPKPVWLHQLNLNSLPPVPKLALLRTLFPFPRCSPREQSVQVAILDNYGKSSQNRLVTNYSK